MNRTEFAQSMAKLAAAYRAEIEQATLDVYFATLGGFDGPVFDAAIQEAIEDLSRFPTIADLRVRALRVRRERNEATPRLNPAPESDLPIRDMVADLKQKMGWK